MLERKASCEQCAKIHDKAGRPTPCDECISELMPENRDAVRVFVAVQDQIIVAPDGSIVGLDQNAVHSAMRLYECERSDVFEAVVLLGREFVRKKAGE